MKIKKAEFIKGIIGDDYSLKDNLPQIAFMGRSNVGKSSVINSLLDRKNIAKTSKIPGKTKEANFFRINDEFYIVDFPGYGYAKKSIKERNKMIKRIFWYLRFSKVKPEAVFLIIDAKVGLTELDFEMIDILKENNHQIIIVVNKTDKIKKEKNKEIFSNIEKKIDKNSILLYSAKTKKGKDEFIEKIKSIIKS